MRRLLERWGFEVMTAGGVAAGVQAAAAQRFDLLICDLGLPDGSGHDLLRQLSAISPVKGIALSGYGQAEDIHRSNSAGFAEHLVKPVNFDLLRKTITRLLSGEQAVESSKSA